MTTVVDPCILLACTATLRSFPNMYEHHNRIPRDAVIRRVAGIARKGVFVPNRSRTIDLREAANAPLFALIPH